MSFRSREMVKRIVKKIGGEKNLAPGLKDELKKSVPNSKVVMGRANRGLYAGRHIQFGNQVSHDGGNKSVLLLQPKSHFISHRHTLDILLVTPTLFIFVLSVKFSHFDSFSFWNLF